MPAPGGAKALTTRRDGSGAPRPRRVAIVHDWLTGMRGGERCLEVVCELFPDAPVFTLLRVPDRVSPTIESRRIVTSFIQRLPGAESHYRNYLPLFPAAIGRFDLRGYELVISLSHCVAKAAPAPREALHLSYCFSPMRYVWDLYDDYFGSRAAWPTRLIMPPIAAALRRWDRDTSGVHEFAAISYHIAERIRRIYGRSSEVIYPPVHVARFQPVPTPDDFYLVVSALVPYKRIDLAVEAATRLRRRLLVVGTGPEAQRLRAVAGPTVEFLGWRSDEEVAELYARCRAVLFPAVEDYGIVPLEAAAAGRPTVALGRGGARETMIGLGEAQDAPTAVFFDEQTVESLSAAILRFEANADRFDPHRLRARATEFDRPLFARRMSAWIEARWAAFSDMRPATTQAC
jgi:glycosyltransferase involved in cell wall biosynthesis